MDRFILLSTMMVFAGLVHTVLSAGVVKEHGEQVQRVNRWSGVVYVALLVFVLHFSFDLPNIWNATMSDFSTDAL